MPELRLGGRRGLHGGTERKDYSQVSGLSTLEVGMWRLERHRRIKGRCQGVKGGEGHADCVPGGSCLSGCRQESRVPASV